MIIRIFNKGFNFSQDGPGNRLVYHLQGCNLYCPWCSNPEGMDISGGESYKVEELISEALSCKPMLFSGGGVTLTGGEPTLQFDAVSELLRGLTDNGINTALESNGTHRRLPDLFKFVDHLILDFKHPDDACHKDINRSGEFNNCRKHQKSRRAEKAAPCTNTGYRRLQFKRDDNGEVYRLLFHLAEGYR